MQVSHCFLNGMPPRELQGIVSLPRCLDGGPIDGPVDCGDPSRRELDGKKVSHGASWTRAQHLCRGMRMLQDASCAQLSNTSFLQEVIQTTGVTYDPRKRDLYGDAAQFMIRTSTGQKIGLWQDPSQFAAAMAYHGSSRHEIRSYIEVGCYTGWTALILTTYLQRIGHRVRGYLIDLNPTAIGPVMPLLARRNLTFRRRSELPEDKMEMVDRAARGRQRAFDLCFIDAQHSYAGVKEDYGEFAPHCRSAMFHDIQDISTWHLGNNSGGVPAFWAALTQNVRAHRLTSITFQIATSQPVFGLGILRPGANASAEPDTPLGEWEPPHRGSRSSLTKRYCETPSPPDNFLKACQILATRKIKW